MKTDGEVTKTAEERVREVMNDWLNWVDDGNRMNTEDLIPMFAGMLYEHAAEAWREGWNAGIRKAAQISDGTETGYYDAMALLE